MVSLYRNPLFHKASGWGGLGVLYLWGTTALHWVPWIQHHALTVSAIGYLLIALASASGIFVFFSFYVFEEEIKDLEEKNSQLRAEKAWLQDRLQGKL